MNNVGILEDFEQITLDEMESVKLMNRTDNKFVFPLAQLESLLEEIKPYYKVLNIDGKKLCRYETLYYDTRAYDLYSQHQRGKLNRYKIRHRTYVDTDAGFLEVKFKNNKGRTIKTRIAQKKITEQWEGESKDFLRKSLPVDPAQLVPVIWVNYYRFTLVNKTGGERVTLDLHLEFLNGDKKADLANVVIAEAKQDKRVRSPFSALMKKHHIREGSVSKYCAGIAFTCSEVKSNNFKMRLKRIKNMNV
jgi:hypothetical protein